MTSNKTIDNEDISLSWTRHKQPTEAAILTLHSKRESNKFSYYFNKMTNAKGRNIKHARSWGMQLLEFNQNNGHLKETN